MAPSRRWRGKAALLVGFAAAVTLGHLLGPHSHFHPAHDDHSFHATADRHCGEAAAPVEDHAEVNCGSLLPAADAAPESVAAPIPWTATEAAAAGSSGESEVGPNGRAPPKRSLLQVLRA